MVDHHAAISEAKARDGQWNLTLRFAEEDMISDFQEYFRETGRRFEVNRLEHPSEPRQREFGLTKEQYEALVLAVRHGYFQIPRTTDVERLGAELDISANAVSQRLRRGSGTLVRNALVVDDDTESSSSAARDT